jgi:hypothetical protein
MITLLECKYFFVAGRQRGGNRSTQPMQNEKITRIIIL